MGKLDNNGGSSCQKNSYLLQVNDALFPIGGYSHSQGLETIFSVELSTMQIQPESILLTKSNGILHTELLAARLAYEAAEKKDLQELCTWKNFWKHPEFLWNREKLPEKWVPVLLNH